MGSSVMSYLSRNDGDDGIFAQSFFECIGGVAQVLEGGIIGCGALRTGPEDSFGFLKDTAHTVLILS